ncbi:MAG: hypothetical protein R2711_03050 [Acidimicrobiales bacterium]
MASATATTTSGRKSSPSPARTPDATSIRSARRSATAGSIPTTSPAVSQRRARRPHHVAATTRATAPSQASAVSPIAVVVSSTPSRPVATATLRPHGRARAITPKVMPASCRSPKIRSAVMETPKALNQAASAHSEPGP